MGCGSSKEGGAVWFMQPNPTLLKPAEFAPYTDGQQLDDDALLQRVYEQIVNEPQVKEHRLIYAVLKSRRKDATEAEVSQLLEDALQVDGNWSKVYSVYGWWLTKHKKTDKAGEVYRRGYEAVFSAGSRMLTTEDVELLALYAAHGEKHGLALPLPPGDLWKDCCLRAPEVPLASGNYGLYLIRHDRKADAMPRLQKAMELEKDPDGFWHQQWQIHFGQ